MTTNNALNPSETGYHNNILAALPSAEMALLRPHLGRMTMVSGQVLHEPNSQKPTFSL